MKRDGRENQNGENSINSENSENEVFFKNLASLYAEKSGNELKKELAELGSSYHSLDFTALDAKVKNRVRTDSVKKWTSRLLPLTACFIFVLMYAVITANLPDLYSPESDFNFNNNAADNAYNADSAESAAADSESETAPPSQTLTFEFIGSKLPIDYILEKVDYDREKAIYYIAGINGVEIILTVEEFTGNINTEGLERISINNKNAYGISKKDFSSIQYIKDDFLYILTSPYGGYYDLIKVSENLV